MVIEQLGPEAALAYQKVRLYALQESPAAFGSSYAEEVDRPLAVVAERLGDKSNHVFGAIDGEGQLAGIVTLRWERRPKSSHKAFIFAMYVLPEYRGQGIGRALLETAIGRARELGLRQLNLSVVEANEAAVHLYESLGFERFGLEKEAFKIDDTFFDVAYMALRLE